MAIVEHGSQIDTNTEDRELGQLSSEGLLSLYVESGDQEAFATLFHRFERELYSYLRRYLGDAVDAEDVFQATFVQVSQKADQFNRTKKVRPWLYTIATNQAIDHQRRNKNHDRALSLNVPIHSREGEEETDVESATSREMDPAKYALLQEARQDVRTNLQLLRPDDQAILEMLMAEKLYREIAVSMGLKLGTVKSRLHEAKSRLRSIFEDHADYAA